MQEKLLEEGRAAQSQRSPGTAALQHRQGSSYRRFCNAGLREKEGKEEKEWHLGEYPGL